MSTLVIHVLLCYVLVNWFSLGVVGVGIATMVTCFSNMVLVSLWCWRYTEYAVFPFPTNPRSLLKAHDLRIYLQIAGPSTLMCCAEWWAYESIVLIATFISVEAVGAMAISQNYIFMIYAFPDGFQKGTIGVIGNIIGEENAKLGKASFRLALT